MPVIESTMMEFPLTLTHILERSGKLFGQVEIVSRMPDKSIHRYRYRDFYVRSRRLAEALTKAGIQPGERVATLMWNHYAHLEAYFAVPATGAVLHTLNLRLSPDDIAYIINHAEDRFLLIDDVLLPLYEQFKHLVSLERVFVVPLSGEPASDTHPYEDYESFLQTATGDYEFPFLSEHQPAGICYTSGTTGRPKGVVYSHRALVLHTLAAGLSDSLAVAQSDVVTPVVPMFHANAWGVPFLATMVGAKQVLPGPHLDAQSLLDLFEEEKVTVAAGVPTIWLGIAGVLEKQPARYKLQKMRMAVGGSAAPEALIRALERFGITMIHAWGMTETAPIASISRPKSYMAKWSEDEIYQVRVKQGTSVPFVEVRIVGEKGVAPWDGVTMGELQTRGPWVTKGYYKQSGESTSITEDGWLRTGDIATIDAEGYIKIMDRTKDLIKSGGEWISSVDLENALMGHPAVAEAAVFAVPHLKWQERPVGAVVLKEEETVTPEELQQYLQGKFAKWWIPDAFVFIEQIPRTSAGKFMKSTLRSRYQDWEWGES